MKVFTLDWEWMVPSTVVLTSYCMYTMVLIKQLISTVGTIDSLHTANGSSRNPVAVSSCCQRSLCIPD